MIKIHIADNVMQLDFWKAAWRRDSELYRILSKQVVKSNKCLPFTTPWSEEDSTRGLMVLCCIPFMNVVVTFPCCLLQIISTPLLEPWLVFSYRLYSLLWTVASFRNMNTTTAQVSFCYCFYVGRRRSNYLLYLTFCIWFIFKPHSRPQTRFIVSSSLSQWQPLWRWCPVTHNVKGQAEWFVGQLEPCKEDGALLWPIVSSRVAASDSKLSRIQNF